MLLVCIPTVIYLYRRSLLYLTTWYQVPVPEIQCERFRKDQPLNLNQQHVWYLYAQISTRVCTEGTQYYVYLYQ